MRRFLLVLLLLLVPFVHPVRASSEQAYQDYLYQFDLYRQKYNDFKVAQNEYFKFATLTSQQTALVKTRDMLGQRNLLLRAYLLLLNEKLNEGSGIAETDRSYYQTLIQNEVAWLDANTKLIPSIGSLADATKVSEELEQHYRVLQNSMLQIIAGISLGNLTGLAKLYDMNLADARALVNANRGLFTPEKQSLLDRWLLQVGNTRSLYQGKVDVVTSKIPKLKGTSGAYSNVDPVSLLAEIKKTLAEARQYLLEGSSYFGEIVRELRYQN